MSLPRQVTVVEVGPRDGLQNEATLVSLDDKRELVERLAQAGLPVIETGSFVSPRWVPQMSTTADLYAAITRQPGTHYPALVPNEHGLDAALAAGVTEIAVFAAVTEPFSMKNLNCSIEDSLQRYALITRRALDEGVRVRGYLSCVLGCPYGGDVVPAQVQGPARRLLDMGCYEVSLGDTIGTGTAGSTAALLSSLLGNGFSSSQLAMHCHDTYGQAIANLLVALQHGIATVDAAVAGLGGCPYARGATGNVATEDVLCLLDGLGIHHGVDVNALTDIGDWISTRLDRRNGSRAGQARLAARAAL